MCETSARPCRGLEDTSALPECPVPAFGTPLGLLLGAVVTAWGSSCLGDRKKDPHVSQPQWLCIWATPFLFPARFTRLGWGYRDHHRLLTMTGNCREFLWLQKLHHIHPEWSSVGHHQGPCPAGHPPATLPRPRCGSRVLASWGGHQDVAGAWVPVCWGTWKARSPVCAYNFSGGCCVEGCRRKQ